MPRTLRILRAALVLLVPSHASAQFDNDQHVAFDNTVTRGSYHYSAGSVCRREIWNWRMDGVTCTAALDAATMLVETPVMLLCRPSCRARLV